ncbi:MAG: hypothetical protein Q8K75_03220 [Chlamydiales bacterium]|nr:hypothetical protein [Chlamydiales bacterium]
MAVTSAGSRPVGHDTWTAQTTKEIEKLTQTGGVTNHVKAVGQVIKLQGGVIGDTASYSWAAVKAVPSLNMSLLVQNVKLALKHAIQAGLTLPGVIVPRLVLTTTQFLDIKGKELPARWQAQAKALATQVRERGAEYAKKVQANPNAMLAVKVGAGLAALGFGGLVVNRFIGGSTPTNVPDLATGLPLAKILGGLIALPLLCTAGWSFTNWRQDRGLFETTGRYAVRSRYEAIGDATAIQTLPDGTLQRWFINSVSDDEGTYDLDNESTICKKNGQFVLIDKDGLVIGKVSEDGVYFRFTYNGKELKSLICKETVDPKDKDEVNNPALYSISRVAYREHREILKQIIYGQVCYTIGDLSAALVADDRPDDVIIAEILCSLDDKLDPKAKKRLLGQFRKDRTGTQERLNVTLKEILTIHKELLAAKANGSSEDVIAKIEDSLMTALQADAIIDLAVQTAIAKNQDAHDKYKKGLHAYNMFRGALELELKEGLPLWFTAEEYFDSWRSIPAQRLKLSNEVEAEIKAEKARLQARDAAVGNTTATQTADGTLQRWFIVDNNGNEQTIFTSDGEFAVINQGAFVIGEVAEDGQHFEFIRADGSEVKAPIQKVEVDEEDEEKVDTTELFSVAQLVYRQRRDLIQDIIDRQVDDTIRDLRAALPVPNGRSAEVVLAEFLGGLYDNLDPEDPELNLQAKENLLRQLRQDESGIQERLSVTLNAILLIHLKLLLAKVNGSPKDVINGIQESLNTELESAPIRDFAVQTAIAKNPKIFSDYRDILLGYNEFRSACGEEPKEAIA